MASNLYTSTILADDFKEDWEILCNLLSDQDWIRLDISLSPIRKSYDQVPIDVISERKVESIIEIWLDAIRTIPVLASHFQETLNEVAPQVWERRFSTKPKAGQNVEIKLFVNNMILLADMIHKKVQKQVEDSRTVTNQHSSGKTISDQSEK